MTGLDRGDSFRESGRAEPMGFVCPQPNAWARIYTAADKAWNTHGDAGIPVPPRHMILAGWYNTESNKHRRWLDLQEWADEFGFRKVVPTTDSIALPDRHEARMTEIESGGALESHWRLVFGRPTGPVPAPDPADVAGALLRLWIGWETIVGSELAACTTPYRLIWRERMTLVIAVDGDRFVDPGGRVKMALRDAMNEVTAPIQIGPILFRTDLWARTDRSQPPTATIPRPLRPTGRHERAETRSADAANQPPLLPPPSPVERAPYDPNWIGAGFRTAVPPQPPPGGAPPHSANHPPEQPS